MNEILGVLIGACLIPAIVCSPLSVLSPGIYRGAVGLMIAGSVVYLTFTSGLWLILLAGFLVWLPVHAVVGGK